MYDSRIILFCLLLKSMAIGGNNTSNNTLGPQGERDAKYGEFIGCFGHGCLEFDYLPIISEAITPDSCTASCKENGFPVAALYNRTECACSCEQTCLTKPLGDVNCGLPCKNDLDRFCGGFTASSLYGVTQLNAAHTICVENVSIKINGTLVNNSPSSNVNVYIGAGIGSAIFLVLTVTLAHLRRRDRRVVYSPRNHSRRWRSDAASQQSEQRPPNETQSTTGGPDLPPRHEIQQLSDVDSMHARRHTDPANTGDAVPVSESSLYQILMQEGGEEANSQDLQKHSLAMENAYAYADCRTYTDSLPRSAAFMHSEPDTPRYPENNEEVEHEMFSNVLYAIAKK